MHVFVKSSPEMSEFEGCVVYAQDTVTKGNSSEVLFVLHEHIFLRFLMAEWL